MSWAIGDRVKHAGMPDWGPGEIISASPDGKVTVYFAFVGEKVLKGAPLVMISGGEAAHPLLDHRIRSGSRGRKQRSIYELKAAFLAMFPDGFSDPHYLATERDYKVAAAELLDWTLNKKEFAALVRDGEYDEICRRALAVSNATNLIFPNEKMSLRDGLKTGSGRQSFACNLFDLLYGTASFKERFETFADTLLAINAAKWTVVTYFPFLAHPGEHMFLKPVVTQHAAEACDFELNYRPELNWLTYFCLLQFAACLKEVVNDLKPRDMIDLQSFIWCIGERVQ